MSGRIPPCPSCPDVRNEQVDECQDRDREVDAIVHSRLIGEEAWCIGVRECGGGFMRWDKGQELEAGSTDSCGRGKGFERDFAYSLWMAVFTVIVVVAAKHDRRA